MRFTNVLGLPEPFVEAASGDGRHGPRPKTYSVTQMLKGVREVILERRHSDEIEVDVSDRVWAIFGTAVHSILSDAQESDTQLKENKVEIEDPRGYKLTGIFDLYDDATGTVTDYKTATVWKVVFDERDDYRTQLLCYCFILRKMGFDARRGQIVALLKDHSKSKARREPDYPRHPVYVKEFDFTDDDFEWCGDFLAERLGELGRCELLPDDELPLCSESERWAKPTKYAVMLKGRKRAVKLYDDRNAADIHAIEIGGYVEERPGTDGKCPEYCAAAPFCSYYRERYGEQSED